MYISPTHMDMHTKATVKYASQACHLKPETRKEYKEYKLQFILLEFIWFQSDDDCND